MRRLAGWLAVLALLAWPVTATATTITPFDVEFNLDGTVHTAVFDGTEDTVPGLGGWSSWYPGALGTLTLTFAPGAGTYTVLGFFDLEIDETVNGFSNEFADVFGVAPAGLTWEIDEPGLAQPPLQPGDIYTNFTAGALDGTNAVPQATPNDVSIGIGWTFTLAADEFAVFTFTTTDQVPPGAFAIGQFDPDSPASVYLTSSMTIRQTSVPEPAALWLFGLGLIVVGTRLARH